MFITSSLLISIKYDAGVIWAVGRWSGYPLNEYYRINSKYFENVFFSEGLIPKQYLSVFFENGGAL